MAEVGRVKLVYFAWVRERIGMADETLALPATIIDIADLMTWLTTQGDGYAAAFANAASIRAAIDHMHVKHDTSIAGAREIAFFPPMTGG